MPTINFPANPQVGDTYDFDSKRYKFDGIKWTTIKFSGPNAVSLMDDHKIGADQHPISGIQGLKAALDKKQDIAKIVGLIDDGAIIEEGSNANGRYVKFKNGTMICYFNGSNLSLPASSAYGALFISDYAWTFPQAFFDTPVVPAPSAKIGSGANWASIGSAPSKTQVVIRVFDAFTSAAASNATILAMAIGRWK